MSKIRHITQTKRLNNYRCVELFRSKYPLYPILLLYRKNIKRIYHHNKLHVVFGSIYNKQRFCFCFIIEIPMSINLVNVVFFFFCSQKRPNKCRRSYNCINRFFVYSSLYTVIINMM